MKPFKIGWLGDAGIGERLIESILAGRKTATSCPATDPEDAELRVSDKLELLDKHDKSRGILVVTRIELRPFSSFDEDLARREGTTLSELKEATHSANGREIRPDEEMRIVHFEAAPPDVQPR